MGGPWISANWAEFLTDRSLYFSLWPRDIREYCLLPLIQNYPMICPPLDRKWEKHLRKMDPVYRTELLPSINDFVVLRNGDLLWISGNEVVRFNVPRKCRIYHGAIHSGIGRVLYDYLTDSLVISTTRDIYQIDQVSSIDTFSGFCTELVPLSDHSIFARAISNESSGPYYLSIQNRRVRYYHGHLICLVVSPESPAFRRFLVYPLPCQN